ncbi:MAG: DUF481 domain-containing protein, partial [Kiritimatiellae bacterium]|nr:DUF481 domain-containing protein [Kiritimatiellia bacterium]
MSIILMVGGNFTAAQDDWNFTLTPYAWMAGLEGDIGVGGVVAPVDESFSDILDNLELALMVGAEARNGAWGLFADGMYLDLEDSEQTAIGKVTVGVQQWLVTAGGLYRMAEDDTLILDVGAGIRYLDTKLDLNSPAGGAGSSDNWIDPLLLSRLRYRVSDKVFLTFAADLGGFGVASDLVWQLTANVGYNLTDSTALLLGYRYLDIDYEED